MQLIKILSVPEFADLRRNFREEGKRVVHCHGVFDLLHPGHIAHLEEAKALGDILVVSVTSAEYVNKGPGRPYFEDELRLKSLAALQCVDYVLLAEFTSALEIIDRVQPDIYVKGREYSVAEDDVTGNIQLENERVELWGGKAHFTNGVTFSSTQLLNRHFDVLPQQVRDFAINFSLNYSFSDILEVVKKMENLKILVIGDIIIDEYALCQVQGLTSKDRAFSVKYDREERYLGGSLAIASHLANFSHAVSVFGIMGDEPHLHRQILNDMSKNMLLDLDFDHSRRTVVKRRYVERKGARADYEKMFSVNFLEEGLGWSAEVRGAFQQKLERLLPTYDLVVVADYGHGLIDAKLQQLLENKARCLALNCQTNSSNFGTNPITKYKRADFFALDEREIRLALADQGSPLSVLLLRLREHFGIATGWLTLGSNGSLCTDSTTDNVFAHPALTLTVQDTVGAGDAFFALVSLAAATGASREVASFLGNIAGAISANYLGNSKSIKKEDALKFAKTLLNI